jgi:regulator of sigma D
MADKTTAFAQLSSFNSQPNVYSDPQNSLLTFAMTPDPIRKAQALQEIYRGLSSNNDIAAGKGFSGSNLDYLNALMRQKGVSKTALTDISALSNVITSAVALNQDPFTFLEQYNASVKGKAIAQPDTTTKFSKQIQSSLQLLDLDDARQQYSDTYFKTYGFFPAADLDKKFQDLWNAKAKSELQPTSTEQKTEYAPVYDKKSKAVIDKATGKQQIDKFGNKVYSSITKNKEGILQYKAITTGGSTAQGQGFTTEEQTQFLATFLSENFPSAKWNVDDIGGAAKTIYDTVKSYHTGNYENAPDFATVSPLIKDILSSPDQKVQEEMFNQYLTGLQKKATGRFMSLKDLIQPGENANKYIDPVLKSLGTALETNVTVKDALAQQVLNFKGEDGAYRMPNDFEFNQLVMNDKRSDATSTAINTAVNMAQSLRNQLR